MSRIGQVPLKIPSGVTVSIEAGVVKVQGPKGKNELMIPKGFTVQQEGDALTVSTLSTVKPMPKEVSMMYGTTCRLLQNVIIGVSQGFEKPLELVGVGYRAELQGKILKLSLGYSHDIFYPIPEGLSIAVEKPTYFKISGIDKQKVGQAAAEIIKFRPPEPYKGKGVRTPGKYLAMKAGKAK